MHNTTVSDAMVEAAIDAWENVYEAELHLGSLAYTDNKEVAMRAAIDAALSPSAAKACGVKATEETLLMMVGTYNRITGYAFPQASHAEQLQAMRAILSCLSHPAQGWREPEGWKLVPVEPIAEMLRRAGHGNPAAMQRARVIYADMLAAAPSTPAGGSE